LSFLGRTASVRKCQIIRRRAATTPPRPNGSAWNYGRFAGPELCPAASEHVEPNTGPCQIPPFCGNTEVPSCVYGRGGGPTASRAETFMKIVRRRKKSPDAQARKALLQRYWRTARGFWTGEARRVAWLMTGGSVLIVLLQLYVQYRINIWNRDIFNAIENRDGATVLY
jgi:hypothetical protein